MKNVFKRIFPLMLVALLTASCGGGGGNQTASGGIGGTGISQGTITEFGSIILNGVKFNTDNATFTVDDNPAGTQADLAVGMQVKIRVSDDRGAIADTVEFEPEVEGPVDARDDNANTLTVLGRTIIVDDNTKIEDNLNSPVAFNTLAKDDMLEVSGLVFSDDKVVQATHIRRRADTFLAETTEVEIKGKIASLDAPPNTFVIGTQLINYGSATFTFTVADNLFVEVKGTRDGANTLNAASIEQEDAFGANAGDKVEIEGLVTSFTSSASFSVNGQAVTTDGTTVFEDGAPDDIAANVRLEVEGTITGGVLVAKKVQFRGNRIKLEATVESTSGSGPNTVTLLGIPVIINGGTEMKDSLGTANPFEFKDIAPTGDPLIIRGYLTGTAPNRIVVATRVERKSISKTLLQAPVDLIANPDLTLLGVTVKTGSTLVFKDRDDNTISATDFFNLVKEGDLVKAKGTFGTTLDAEEVELEG